MEVFHHLSASDYARMPLAELLKSKHRMGSKPTAYTKAFVSSAMALYNEEMQLVLPLPVKGGKTYEEMRKGHEDHSWRIKQKNSQNE